MTTEDLIRAFARVAHPPTPATRASAIELVGMMRMINCKSITATSEYGHIVLRGYLPTITGDPLFQEYTVMGDRVVIFNWDWED